MDEYLTSTKEKLEDNLGTNLQSGLTQEQVTEKQKKEGRNELPKGKVTPWYVMFLKTLVEPVQIILMVAAVISVIAPMFGNNWQVQNDSFIDFGVIMGIVLIDGILETVQAVKARKSMDALKSLSKPKAVVVRNGQQQEIDASELVVGDIVVLEAGKFVPADLRIIESSDLMIDESILTGESLMVEKTHEAVEKTNILAEMKNIAFMSTFTTNGRAVGMVIKIGVNTEIGKIATSINENEESSTPLERKLTIFSYWIAGLSFVIGGIIFAALYFTGHKTEWSGYLMVAITLAIGVIPESLSAVVSITLSLSTKRMARQNVIVKKLASVETLGSVNIICTDKTGTLTQNKMTVQKMIMDNNIVDGKEYAKEKVDNHMELFLKSLVLCNDSVTEGKERIGDPTELALVDYAEILGWDEQDARDKWTRIDEIPFDSERKMMTTVNSINGVNTTFTKGAIDQLLNCCSKIMIDNTTRDITEKDKEELLKISNSLSGDALRVLAFAYNTNYDQEKDKDDLEHDLVFLGGIAMIDPVRTSAIQAVKSAHDAGIEVVMITGDHAVTALAIAKDLDLAHSEYEVMSSERLEKMSDEQLLRIIENIKVFARVNPEHKVRIVDALQKRQNITSMTGDGVNDAPSLSKADIGVAMGITGTDVAKQAADVILTDDNFETIIKGVYEGRNVYQKIKRAIAFVIGVNLANVLSIFILSLINNVSPLEATDILWMNLVIESVLAIAMGMGNNDPSLMKQKPVKGKNSLFSGLFGIIFQLTIFTTGTSIAAFYVGMTFADNQYLTDINKNFNGMTWYEIIKTPSEQLKSNTEEYVDVLNFGRTAMFVAVTCAPSMYVNLIKLSNWKSSKKVHFILNRPLLIASAASIILNCAVIFIPGLNDTILDLTPLGAYNQDNWYMFLYILILSISPTLIMLIISGIRFLTYHYMPEAWTRNRWIISEMVKKDKESTKKRKKRK